MDKTSTQSYVVSTHVVMPGDTNFHGTLFGGKLASWFDVCAAISAQRHCEESVVTASIDRIDFIGPVKLGDVVEIEAWPTYVGHKSIEVTTEANVLGQKGGRTKVASAFLTFVRHDRSPIDVPLVAVCGGDYEMIEEGRKRYLLRKAQRAN